MEINLFEAFAGIGSQYKALKNISKKLNWNIKHLGMAEWFIDALIAYVAIHEPNFHPKKEKLLDNIILSNDSKNHISKLYSRKLDNTLKASYINYSKTHFNNIFDIKLLTFLNLPKNLDIFTYSFPCQDISVQGKQKGFAKNLKTILYKFEI